MQTARWLSLSLILLTTGALVSSAAWDLSVPISHTYRAGTRGGCLKLYKDWNADSPEASTWSAANRVGAMAWLGHWQYSPVIGWVQVPLWVLALPPALLSAILWQHTAPWRVRRWTQRGISAGAILSVASLLAALVVSMFWQATRVDHFHNTTTLARGGLSIELNNNGGFMTCGPSDWSTSTATSPIMWLPAAVNDPAKFRLELPLWLLLIPAASLAAAWCWHHLGDRRNWPRHCVECGYNKSGLLEGAACPECGKVSPSSARVGKLA